MYWGGPFANAGGGDILTVDLVFYFLKITKNLFTDNWNCIIQYSSTQRVTIPTSDRLNERPFYCVKRGSTLHRQIHWR